MQIIKYRPHNISKRDLTPIIDAEKSVVYIAYPNLILSVNTAKPHRLNDKEEVEISTEFNAIVSPIQRIDDNNFRCAFNVMKPIQIIGAEAFNDSSTMVSLTEEIDILNLNVESFSIYNNAYDAVYEDCYIPVTETGTPLKRNIIIPVPYTEGLFTGETNMELYILNTDLAFVNGINIEKYTIRENRTYVDINLPIVCQNENNLLQDDIFNKLIEDTIIENTINPISDQEKQIFNPYIKLEDGTFIPAQEINLDFHFRRRDVESANTWSIVEGHKGFDNWNEDAKSANTSDSLIELGFTDDDIRYQKKRLKKSFARLLFYDSPDATNQSLLFYSTAFLDSTDYYSKYNKNKMKCASRGEQYSLSSDTSNDLYRLDSKITIHDRYDYTKSSEGFYLYLYPTGMVKNVPKTIYMKVEFNHAGYGKTVPLAIPCNNNGDPYEFAKEGFPTTYTEIDKDDRRNVNMAQYFKDLYIPVNIEYNADLNQFIYYFPFIKPKETDRKINLTLFELRVNGIDS